MARTPATPAYRPATRGDTRGMWDLWEESYLIEDPARLARWRKIVDGRDGRVVVHDGRVVACGDLLGLEMYVGGHARATGGIAAVASASDARRQGHVGVLLEGMLRDMRAARQPWSLLMPFSAPFYARYGWATAEERRVVTLPLAALAQRAKSPGRIRRATARDLAACTRIYETWGHTYNLMLRRSATWWKTRVLMLQRPSAGSTKRWFVALDERGAIDGYVVIHFEDPLQRVAPIDSALHRQLHIRDIAWITPRARAALLAFLGDFDSQAGELVWRIAPDDPLIATLPLAVPPTITHRPAKMARVVDVRRAFAGAPSSTLPGLRAVIEVEDAHAPWNAGRWSLESFNGRLKVTASTATPDVACSINVLTQVALGVVTAETVARNGLAAGPHPDALGLVESVGAGRPAYLADAF